MRNICTNKINAKFNFQNIKQDFDIFKVTTTEKYISGGSYLLDKPLVELKARSLVFENGKSFYVLFKKNSIIANELIKSLSKEEKGDTLSIELISADKVPKYLMLQLFLNSINNPANELLGFNNLTGKLLRYQNEWIDKDKEGFIWGLDCLELRMASDMCLRLMAHRFSPISLKNKMNFQKRQFHEYPQYLFADHNHALKRANKEHMNDKENFIMKPLDGKRASITYLDFKEQQKFECSKIGALYKVLSILKEEFSDYIEVELSKYEVKKCLEYKNNDLGKFKDLVKEIVASNGILLLDCIKDESSELYLSKIKEKLQTIVPNTMITEGKRVSNKKLNIKLIHNKEYYEQKSYDPHNDINEGIAVQHITLEDFKLDADAVISNVLKELVIKNDLTNNKITIVNWESYSYKDDFVFGMKIYEEYYFMKIHPDGKFQIDCMKRDLFSLTEYDKYMDYFGNNDNSNNDFSGVVGLIKNASGSINLIMDTNQITMPEVNGLGDTLELAARDFKFSGSYIISAFERIIQSGTLNDKNIKIFKEIELKFDPEVDYDKAEVLIKIESSTAKKKFTKFVFEDIGELLYLYLRNEGKRNELLPGVLDINYIEISHKEAVYNVGTVGAGMQSRIERASVLRKVESVDDSKLFFQELLPLMGVEFVRYGMLTVIPFPFKYLREYGRSKKFKEVNS